VLKKSRKEEKLMEKIAPTCLLLKKNRSSGRTSSNDDQVKGFKIRSTAM